MKKCRHSAYPAILVMLAIPVARAQSFQCTGQVQNSDPASFPAAAAFAQAQLPDAPQPQASSSDFNLPPLAVASVSPSGQNSPQQTVPPAPTAEQQLRQQKSQRIFGIVPQFNISYAGSAASLTARQKFSLALRTLYDPYTVGSAFVTAGYREAFDDDIGFHWGGAGYMRRTGASYLDTFDGTIIGGAALPVLFRQDPRYFRLGHGTVTHRIFYALATNFISRHDHTGRWEPNYSNVIGNVATGALSNLYYPRGTTGLGQTLTNGIVVTLEGGVGTLFNEFWPDISRAVLHKDPTNGQDAAAAARQRAVSPPTAPAQPTPQR